MSPVGCFDRHCLQASAWLQDPAHARLTRYSHGCCRAEVGPEGTWRQAACTERIAACIGRHFR
jgi:hypothetical protein